MKSLVEKSSSFLTFVFNAALILLIITLQHKHDELSPPFTTKLKTVHRTLTPSYVLPYTNFGFSAFLADYYWIRAVQDLVAWDTKDLFYIDYFKNITTLDPKFEYPYLFAILAVPQYKDVDTLDRVAEISQKGIDNIKESWKIPYYLATRYYLFTKTYDTSLPYLAIAANIPSAPSGVFLTYSSFLTKKISGDKAASEFMKVIVDNTDNETIKKLAALGIQEKIISQLLEKAIAAYKAQTGVYPRNISEIEKLKLISLPRNFSDFFTVTINPANGSFRVMVR